jgi:hypothetical protein
MVNRSIQTIAFIFFLQQLIVILKKNSTRWIIKNWFTSGEIVFTKWYSIEFLRSLTTQRIVGLGIIASFTLITFPLGIWLASYSTGVSVPITLLLSTGISFFTFPLTIWTMSRVLNEFSLNQTTITGCLIIEFSKFLVLWGGWLLYIGGNK